MFTLSEANRLLLPLDGGLTLWRGLHERGKMLQLGDFTIEYRPELNNRYEVKQGTGHVGLFYTPEEAFVAIGLIDDSLKLEDARLIDAH